MRLRRTYGQRRNREHLIRCRRLTRRGFIEPSAGAPRQSHSRKRPAKVRSNLHHKFGPVLKPNIFCSARSKGSFAPWLIVNATSFRGARLQFSIVLSG